MDLLDRAVPVSELADDFIKMVIYGENRVGKTTLACQFPKPLLLVAMEPNKSGGARSVKKVPGVSYLRVDNSLDAVTLARQIAARGYPYKTVVVDSATSYQDIILKEILGLSHLPEQLNWGTVSRDQYRERSEKTREALRPYLDLECHVVVTAKQRDHNPPKDDKPEITRKQQHESFFAADLGGATVGWLHDACDYIGRLYVDKETVVQERKVTLNGKTTLKREEVETGRVVRRLRTMYHPNYAAGFRSCDPDKVPEYIEEPTYDKIQAVIDGE